MWMQKSVEGSSFSSSGNFHDRNRFGSPYAQGGNSYGGNGADAGAAGAGDWKSKILESGQWLGGKVIEYGGKLARGPGTDAIPDHYAPQMPRNDGRANWMADIRSSSSSYAGGGAGAGTGAYSGSGGGYQNDFATERPKAYADYGNGYSGNPGNPGAKPYGGYEPKSVSSSTAHHHGKSRHAKKKAEGKKSKKSKKSKRKQQSESESEELSESVSESESSETESPDERRHKSKRKSKTKKHSGFYSESESEGDDKKAENYTYSFDPAKLPPPPVEEKVASKKAKKSKKDKASKKARARRQSVESTDESASDKESARKAKKRGSKKVAAVAARASASVDLLGVDLDVQPAAQPTTAGLPAQVAQPSIFDAPQSQNPLQDLAGLSFAAPVQVPAPVQQSVFDGSTHAAASNEAQAQPQQQAGAFRTNLLPENNIVDFNSLASDKKKSLSANPAEKRTLNDLQKARGAEQPTPVMAMPMQGQQQMQQQNISGGMMQLNMNQLQITDGATGMQQQMYPNMQMQQMPMQGMSQQQMQPQMMMMQPQMGMMAQPQMMNMQMMQQQQFAQGGASMVQPTQAQQGMVSGATNPKSADPFNQLP